MKDPKAKYEELGRIVKAFEEKAKIRDKSLMGQADVFKEDSEAAYKKIQYYLEVLITKASDDQDLVAVVNAVVEKLSHKEAKRAIDHILEKTDRDGVLKKYAHKKSEELNHVDPLSFDEFLEKLSENNMG